MVSPNIRTACRPALCSSHRPKSDDTAEQVMPRTLSYRAGAEFWCAFFFTSTIALPVLFYATGVVTLKALLFSLSGVLVCVLYVGTAKFLQARAGDDDAFHNF